MLRCTHRVALAQPVRLFTIGQHLTRAAQAGDDSASVEAMQTLVQPLLATADAAAQAGDNGLLSTAVAALLDVIERPKLLPADALQRVAALGVGGACNRALDLGTRGHCSQVRYKIQGKSCAPYPA
jgi:hypothetical protein